jgi:uncharacterized membrane protein YdbT with pleckstrin-like domain
VLRLVPPGDNDTVPALVGWFLLPSERHVISVRQHPVVLAWRTLAVLAGLAAAGWLSSSVAHGNNTTILVIWLLWLVVLLWLVAKIIDWWFHYFVITSKRIVLVTGVLLRSVNALPLSKVTDLELRQSQPGRLLGYCRFEIYSQGQDLRMRTFKYLPYPGQLYLEAAALIFTE